MCLSIEDWRILAHEVWNAARDHPTRIGERGVIRAISMSIAENSHYGVTGAMR
jgi:hypothetical protein